MPVGARPQAAWRPQARPLSARVNRRTGVIRAAVGFALAAGLLFGSAVPANAVPPPPDNPSDQQIEQGQDQAAASAAEVGRLAGLVAQTQGDIDRLHNDLEMKAELANKARVDLSVAQSDAAAAASASQQAQNDAAAAGQAVADAKQKAAAFAAASFRQGSVLGSLSAYWDAGSAGDVLQRQELLGQVSGSQLNAMSNLEATRTHKANQDSAARAALDAANAARARADQAKVTADRAQQEAADALQAGEDQLASLQAQHDQQERDYQAALANVAGLQNQRDQYNQWLAQKQAEEEAARLAAEEAARQAAAAEAARQEAARQEAARQAAAAQAAAEAAAAQAQAEAEAEAERQSAAREAANQAARAAQEAQANPGAPTYASCDEARAAGRGPIPQGDPAYRSELDPNNNGTACDGGSSGNAQASSEPYYANCDDARSAGVAPINRGSAGYRAALDPNDNGIACEGTVSAAQPASYSSSSGGDSSSRGQRVVNAAKQWLGTTYAWGGGDYDGPTLGIRDGGVADRYGDYRKVGFDCSGLALYAWSQVGVYLPHYSVYQYTGQSAKVSRSDLQPGDLVFWANNTSDPSTIHHVAIWIGNNQIIEAPNSGSYVKISTMYWNGYIGAVRPG
ncbi:NLP/P60 protein [Nakamurella multipartita DSM 44233]|uniref:NLP/P60 protein n=1 Tax=Nakamurella multipartita (strain ATCC 700099 / DSM 44233 / CIP 104796 / JCM 9543 / NBRC 105858 / Y-104) TaxID=479431 RepID=C8XKB1_NAKMY|nr:NLP/P60 protein [Nakamurella multipartita DSM 44233]